MATKLQKIQHEMRIPELDVTHIVLSVYLLTLIHRYELTRESPIRHEVNLIQLKTFELELDFAEYYAQHTGVRTADLC